MGVKAAAVGSGVAASSSGIHSSQCVHARSAIATFRFTAGLKRLRAYRPRSSPKMLMSFFLSSIKRRSLALAVVAGTTFTVAGAQTAPSSASTEAAPSARFGATVPGTVESAATASLFSSSITSDAHDAASTAAQTNLASLEKGMNLPGLNAQYGRRRYGAPRYRGSNTNADGSEKYDAFVGGGFTIPLGDTHKYYTPSWGFQVGGGRNFNKNFGVNLQFDWDEFGLQSSTIQQQIYIYDAVTASTAFDGYLDGYSHVWSLSVDPIYNLKSGEGLGAYVTAGVGFYHKITTFTYPQDQTLYTYYGPISYVANAPIDSYTSNAPGVNGGFGITYKFSRFANERLYGEVRYVVTFNSQRQGINGSNYNNFAPTYAFTTTNLFPANSNRSNYLPVKFGIRF